MSKSREVGARVKGGPTHQGDGAQDHAEKGGAFPTVQPHHAQKSHEARDHVSALGRTRPVRCWSREGDLGAQVSGGVTDVLADAGRRGPHTRRNVGQLPSGVDGCAGFRVGVVTQVSHTGTAVRTGGEVKRKMKVWRAAWWRCTASQGPCGSGRGTRDRH